VKPGGVEALATAPEVACIIPWGKDTEVGEGDEGIDPGDGDTPGCLCVGEGSSGGVCDGMPWGMPGGPIMPDV